MTSPGAAELLDCGLLQFGLFGEDPLRVNLDMLPSFPRLLQQLAACCAPYLVGVDRLLAAPGALAWGSAVALHSGLPLVYCRGNELVGAYDIGHPTLLLACGLESETELPALAGRAQRVGLEVQGMLQLLGDGRSCAGDYRLNALFCLPQVVEQLVEEGSLPPGQGKLVQRWLLSRRRDAAGP